MNLAIFGGTFDPIHNAHLEVARAARRECFLDRILFVPASHPPHKTEPCAADYEHRYEMVRLACTEHPAFEASRLEAPARDRARNYTIQTVRRLQTRISRHDRLFFLIGSDAFSELPTWYHWRHLTREIEFIVVNRPGFILEESQVPPEARVHWLRSVSCPISSTDVRSRLQDGRTTRGLIPPAVARYVRRQGLYQPPKRTTRRKR